MTPKKRNRPQVSIILLTYNHAKLTLECLNAIKTSTNYSPFEVIVVDNRSKAEELRLLKSGLRKLSDLQLRVIYNPKNFGYAKANNKAAVTARGKILVFLNNDVIVTPGWLTAIVAFLKKYPKVAACQPKVRSYIQKEYFDYAGGAGGFLDMFGYPFTRGRVFDHIEKDVGQYNTIREITWATGACFVVKKDAFWEVGGFDEYFFIYYEEIDLSIRLRQVGYKIFCIPKSLVYHYGSYTNDKRLPWKIFLLHHNNLYFVLKHYSIWPYFPLIFSRFLFDFGSILYYLGELRFSFVLSVVRAYLKLFLKLPDLMRNSTISFKGRSLLNDRTIYKGSVVIKYFLLGYRNFDQLIGKYPTKLREHKRYKDITFFDQ